MTKRTARLPSPEQLEASAALRRKIQNDGELKQRLSLVNDRLREEARTRKLGYRSAINMDLSLRMSGDKDQAYAMLKQEFREFIRAQIEADGGTARLMSLIAAAIEAFPRSNVTIRRWLGELSTRHGPFVVFGLDVFLNKDYCPPEENPYWKDDSEDELVERDDERGRHEV